MASNTQLTMGEEWIKQLGLYWYEDLLLPPAVDVKLIPRIKSFNFADDDILISTFPRSGTTWAQEMTWLVCNNADTDGARATDIEARSPYIEFDEPDIQKSNIDILEERASPRIIKTHFPPQFYKTGERNFKTILVMRNVKDVLVSNYHFCRNVLALNGDWDGFFEMFKKDQLFYGSWLRHVLQCWKLRDDPNVLLLKYEDTQRDHIGTIRKIAEFCGKALTDEQIKAIAEYTTVGNMKKVYASGGRVKGNSNFSNFVRRGVVGEWNEWFSPEQLEFVQSILKEAEKEGLVFDDRID